MRASIYQRKSDGKWVGSISAGKRPDGSRNRIPPVYGNSKKEAEEKANKVLYELQTGQYHKKNKDTLIAFLKEYHNICAGYDMWNPKAIQPKKAKWAETTSELYKMYIDVHFEPYFNDDRLRDVKTSTLDIFYNFKTSNTRKYTIIEKGKKVTKIAQPLSINTVNKLNKFLKAAFNYAVINDRITKNPTNGVKLLSPEKYKPTIYDKEQFMKLLQSIHGQDEEIPIVLGAGCGLRRGEICGLKWKNINFDTGIMIIDKTRVRFKKTLEKDPKNDSSIRQLKAPEYVIKTLKWYYLQKNSPCEEEFLITRWKPQSLSERFSNLLDKFNMPHIRLHDLRHYNAVAMMNTGIPDKVAAERLGHSNVATLHNIYQHVLKSVDDEAAQKINSEIDLKNSNKNKVVSIDEVRKETKAI
jgi:integrase